VFTNCASRLPGVFTTLPAAGTASGLQEAAAALVRIARDQTTASAFGLARSMNINSGPLRRACGSNASAAGAVRSIDAVVGWSRRYIDVCNLTPIRPPLCSTNAVLAFPSLSQQ
jgi:hypothetical protein